MQEVLYEVSFNWDIMYVVEVGLIIATILMFKHAKVSGGGTRKPMLIIIPLIVVSFVCTEYTKQNLYIINRYKTGDYSIVEGTVENYKPMPVEGHANESFSISGIEFSYSNISSMAGYSKTKHYGGVITGDGQRLKVGYVEYKGNKYIVYISEVV